MLNRLKEIVIVGPALKMGGMERATANIANGFTEQGYEVTLITIFEQPIFFTLHNTITLITPKMFNSRRLHFWRTLIYLRSSIVKAQPDIVLVYNKFYAALVLLALFFDRSIPVVISERSSPLYAWSFPVRLFNRIAFALRPAQGIIAQTAVAAQFQRKYYGSKIPIRVIPNILRPVKRFSEVEREKIILAVGRLNDPLKGFDRLLQAFALVNLQGWQLQLAGGEQDQDPSLSNLISKLALGNTVEFLGKVEEIDFCYARASIFVIPSRSEGFPNALCEAMSAGLACISFDFVAGPNELIEHRKNGWLVPDGDIEELAVAIELLANNEQLRIELAHEAESITDRLSGSQIIHQHSTFFKNAGLG